jgi:hypothetical protein
MANCEFGERIIAKKMVRFVGDSNPGLSGSLLDMTAFKEIRMEKV